MLPAAVPIGAQAWNSPAALDLAQRAIARRTRAAADTTLRDYKAQAHGFLFFLGQLGEGLADPPRLIKADQLELEVYWKAPASSKQRVVGWRDRAELPTDIYYHRDHLGIVQNNFGPAIRLGEGDEVRDVPHPLSTAGPDLYDYALADTTTITFPAREVRVVTLRVRPKDFDAPRIVGVLYMDATTADLVRLAFNFTPHAYLDAQLEDVSIVLDNALWEGRFWLPYRQELEIRRRATWLDMPARGIIRARWEIDGYVFNVGLAASWFQGDEITFLPKAERDSFPWREPLAQAIHAVAEPVRQNDLERVRAEVEQIAGRRALTGLKAHRLGVRGLSDLVRANRVEGLTLGAGLVWRGGGERRELRLTGSYGFSDRRPKGSVTATDREGRRALEATVFREVRDVGDERVIAPLLNSVTAQPASGGFRPNPALGDVGLALVQLALRRRSEGFAVRRDVHYELVAEAGRTDARTGYLRLSGTGHLLLPAGATRLLVRAHGGAATRDLPAHRSFVLGGRGTLLGDDFRRWGGGRMALAHVEWRIPLPFPSLGLGPYARTPHQLTVAPYVAAGWADRPVPGAPWAATPGTRVTFGAGLEWLGVFRFEAGVGAQTHRAGFAFDVTRDFWGIL